MKAYIVGLIHKTRFGPDVVEYLRHIDATLAPFAGRYLVHGGPYLPLEGEPAGDLIVIEFPSKDQALGWYHSDDYSRIKPLRTNHCDGVVFMASGVPDTHKATDILTAAPEA
ncbi:MAG: DUF1330 domain-containing protein [Rhodocyclaceae bacterium]